MSNDVEGVLQTEKFRSEAARGGLGDASGFGALAGDATATSGRPAVPVVNPMTEKSLPGIGG